jgi:hypothetical protein
MKQAWDKVRIKSTVNVCFWQAKTDKCPISGSNDSRINLWKKKFEVNLNKFT